MYIYASDLFRKRGKYIFKDRNLCCVGRSLAYSTYFFLFKIESDESGFSVLIYVGRWRILNGYYVVEKKVLIVGIKDF